MLGSQQDLVDLLRRGREGKKNWRFIIEISIRVMNLYEDIGFYIESLRELEYLKFGELDYVKLLLQGVVRYVWKVVSFRYLLIVMNVGNRKGQ